MTREDVEAALANRVHPASLHPVNRANWGGEAAADAAYAEQQGDD